MKKVYVVPKTKTENVTAAYMLASSCFAGPEDVFATATQNGWTIQLCPYNNERCQDKQRRFNDWCNAVKHYAAEGINYLFYTSNNMFDGCPYGYSVLCAQHEQRQRG